MKRLACLVLAIVLAVMLLPVSQGSISISAKASVIMTGSCGANGSNLSWKITSDGELIISGTGEMRDYDFTVSDYAPWIDYEYDSVIVEEGVTSIGDGAFYSGYLPGGVSLPSSLVSIGDRSFQNTTITSIQLPVSLASIGAYAFYRSDLKNIVMPESVESVGEKAFSECRSLTSAVIPAYEYYILESPGSYVFSDCTSLKTVIIRKGMEGIPDGLFYGCSALTSVVLPESVTYIGRYAFENCSSLKQISIPKMIKAVYYGAFSGCDVLTEVDYGGSQSDWSSINTWEYDGDPLLSATIYYNSYNPFTDISATDWHFRPVLWAYNEGVTAGTTQITFEPNKTCTRAEFVTFLYKFVGKPWDSSWASECSFSDVKSSDWYYRAVVWANHAGVTHGTSSSTFSPNVTLDRGMVISFLYNMEKYQNGTPNVTLTSTKFTDVTSDKYYYRPVLWAEQYKITNGTTATTFSPGKKCTRAEAVAFLYNINKYWNK